MRVHICAVGRLRAGPELDMIKDYTRRFDRVGRNLGLGPLGFIEVEDKRGGGMSAEAKLLGAAIPHSSTVCALDERGKHLTSPEFAADLAQARDQGVGDFAFIIGGADGIDPTLRTNAHQSVSFGKMVWPHMLVRAMLTEQLYRAASILAGAPYHRV